MTIAALNPSPVPTTAPSTDPLTTVPRSASTSATAVPRTAGRDVAGPGPTGGAIPGPSGWSGRAGPRDGGDPRPRLRLLRTDPDPDPDDEVLVGRPAPARHPPAPDDLRPTPELRRRAHQVLRLALEVVDGRRPLAHVAPHLEPCAMRYVRAACGPRPTAGPPRRLTSLHVSRPSSGAVEVAAVHSAGGRSRVLAARFEGRPDDPGRWRCHALRLL